MTRFATSCLLALALFLAPALCGGGMLEHACECGNDVQCHHEEACPDDPCSAFTRSGEQDAEASLTCGAFTQPAASTPWDSELESARNRWSSPPAPPPDRSSLPYAQSDRPLRI
jgi:hypothetical protein